MDAAETRSGAVRRALAVVLGLNILVLIVKFAVGIGTGSLTVLGAALESGLDLLNNVIGMVLVTIAARGPDEDHPYGHAKFETLGALGIVGFLSISCFELLRGGITHLIEGGAVPATDAVDIGIMAATLVVNGFVVWYERRRGRALASAFLLADSAHTRSDVLVTLLAIASLALSYVGHERIDSVLAILVALLIARSGWHILRDSIPILVDQRAINAADLARVVCAIPHIVDVRQVRSRKTTSGVLFVELTVLVAGTMTVAASHELADRVEAAIADAFGASEVTVHLEPV
jgi:cation diffusion facilitator family transporter